MALTPEYLDTLPDAVVTLWQQAEDDILRDVARRLTAAGELTSSAAWQLYRLAETQALRADIIKLLAKYTGRSNTEIRKILQQAGAETLAADDALYRAMGFAPAGINENPALLNLLNAGYRQTLGSWKNLTATTANTVTGEFEQRLDRAWLQLSSGAFDYNTVIKRAVHDLARSMKFVQYPTGHKDTLEVAVRRCVLTGANQTCGKLQLARANEMGCEFVEVSAHAGARPTHAVWQGKVYHKGGAVVQNGVAYPDFETATGYGTGPGLCGWNCRHNFFPFWPGISVRNYDDAKLAELAAKTETYQGKQYSKYEISQMQRALERKVRSLKKRYVTESAAGVDTGNTAARLSGANAELRKFIKDTGGKVDGARTDVTEMGYKVAQEAEKAAFVPEKSNDVFIGSKTADLDYIRSDAYKKKFQSVSDNQALNRAIYERCKAEVTHQSGGVYEDLAVIRKDGSLVGLTTGVVPYETRYTEKLKQSISAEPAFSLVSIHNHGTNLPPSGADFVSAGSKRYAFGIVACHDGRVFLYSSQNAKPFTTSMYDSTVDKYCKPPYNFNKYSAMIHTLEKLAKDYGIEWRELT